MPIIIHSSPGRVTGLWGSALIRLRDGKLRALKIGDQINKGDLLLTSQDGIVEFTEASVITRLAVPAESIPELLNALNKADALEVPSGGPVEIDGSGLGAGERVARVDETLPSTPIGSALATSPTLPESVLRVAPELMRPAEAGGNAVIAIEEGPAVSLHLTAPATTGSTQALTVASLPQIGEVRKADGTALTQGMPLSPADLAGLVYLPPNEYDGRARVGEFSYTLDDALTRVTRSVQILVIAVNDAPIANPARGTGLEDTSIQLVLSGQDVDGSIAAFTVLRIPSQGQLQLAGSQTPVIAGQTLNLAQAGGLTFRPDADFHGDVEFSFQAIDDGGRSSAAASYALTITPVNDPPVSRSDTAQTQEDTIARLDVLANDRDVDGDSIRVTAVQGVPIDLKTTVSLADATVALNPDGTLTVTPRVNFHGPIGFSYSIDDGALIASAGVTVNFTAVNDAPTALPEHAVTPINTPLAIDALANDGDVDADRLVVATANLLDAASGTVAITPTGAVLFTPALNFSGTATIDYTVRDPSGASAQTQAIIEVGTNTSPTASDHDIALLEDSTHRFSAAEFGFRDPDALQALAAIRIESLPTAGNLTLNGFAVVAGQSIRSSDIASLLFAPLPNANALPYAQFGFKVQDTAGAFSKFPNFMVLNVTPVNDAPTANADSASTNQNQPLLLTAATLLANDVDIDSGDTLQISSVQKAVNGSVAIDAAGNVVFTPASGYFGPASFAYSIVDSAGAGATSSVNVAVVSPTAGPFLIAPGPIFSLAEGGTAAAAITGIPEFTMEQTVGLAIGALDTIDPPAGALTAHAGTVNVLAGGLTSQSVSMRAGTSVVFNWSFFNEEDLVPEINTGYNDLLLVVITDPGGGKQVVQLTSSEQTGPNLNGSAVDAAGAFQFTAGIAGSYDFAWLVTNGRDLVKHSSMSVESPRFLLGGNSFGTAVPFDITAQSTDAAAAASLLVTVSGVPAASAFSAGIDLGGGSWQFLPVQLNGLEFLPPAGFTGSIDLTVSASTIDPLTGALLVNTQNTVVTIDATSVSVMGNHDPNVLLGTPNNDHIQGFGADDQISGFDGNDRLFGDAGNDTLNGGGGNDTLYAGTGDDIVFGEAGADRLSGGAGSDITSGGSGSDVFFWSNIDRGVIALPAIDTLTDFSPAAPAAGGDVLDLRDLLIGEASAGFEVGNLEGFLDFDTTSTPGSTIIRISSSGGFSAGVYAPGAEDQRIVLQAVDLRASDVFGLSAASGDNEIIQQLLQRGKLYVDGA